MERDENDEPVCEALLMTSGRVNLSDMAKNNFNEAQKIIEAYNAGQLKNPEPDLRSALDMLLSVFWINKDLRVPVSRQMHSIGMVLHETYGCAFGFENGFILQNAQTCFYIVILVLVCEGLKNINAPYAT